MSNRPNKGTYIVLSNGYIEEFKPDLDDDGVFPSYDEAFEHVHRQQEAYPDLDYYICPVMELHHTTVQRHKRTLIQHMGGDNEEV